MLDLSSNPENPLLKVMGILAKSNCKTKRVDFSVALYNSKSL
jgi:hypothetical protein